MHRAKSIKQQQFFLLVFTLSILAVAILLLSLRERVQHDFFRQISNHQLIIYHVEKAREELQIIKQYLLIRQLHDRRDTSTSEALVEMSGPGGFNQSVSIHALRGHVRVLLQLQKKTESYGPLSLKLERQLDELLAPDGRLGMDESAGLDKLKMRIEGLILSMEQLGGMHGRLNKTLVSRQTQVTDRDNIILIFIVTTLVLLSYLSISSIMGRIRTMVEEQSNLARELELKNDELERFTYTASHDLKSPLFTIKNFIGMLERSIRADDRKKVYQDLKHISTAADDMVALLEGLLELSRIGRIINPPQSGRLIDLVERSIFNLRPKIEARGVVIQVDEDIPDYWGDCLRLQEVVQNLIENAVKFMGGSTCAADSNQRETGRRQSCLRASRQRDRHRSAV